MKKFFAMVKETTGKDNASKERRLTMMMFSVVILFLISNTMRHLCIILFKEKVTNLDTTIILRTNSILRPFYTFFQVMNSSVNIFFYAYFNQVFRQNLIALFDCVRLPCFKKKTETQGELTHLTMATKVTGLSTSGQI